MKKDKAHDERRQSPRFRAPSLLKYTILPGTSSAVANIQNISLGGLAFLANQEIQPGTALKICFVIPYLQSTVEVQGNVVRFFKDARDPSLFQIAVQFTVISEEAKLAIRQLKTMVSGYRKKTKK